MGRNKMVWNKIFPQTLRKKLAKTTEARTGKGIYKRRNSRVYRVIMHLETYKRIIKDNPIFLKEFSNGYAVRVKPTEYFPEKSLPEGLVLGNNAFIYYKTAKDLRDFPVDDNWTEVYELYTSNNSNKEGKEWVGEYAYFVSNTKPQRVSKICETGTTLNKETEKWLKETYKLTVVPQQAGLGNFDYDYCSKEEMKNIQYQLSYLILSVVGIEKALYDLCIDPEIQDSFDSEAVIEAIKGYSFFEAFIFKHKLELEKYCEDNGLIDLDKLDKIRAWDLNTNQPICPLCRSTLDPKDFFETVNQVEGREEEDNTQSAIALMHIEALQPGKLNHRTYNLGWGHKHCNTIQADKDIEDVIEELKRILISNGYKIGRVSE
jgi:hypothetical protein